jgi:hypothetical protein
MWDFLQHSPQTVNRQVWEVPWKSVWLHTW